MATKAAERARQWLLDNFCINQVVRCKHEVITDESITKQILAAELLAEYEAATIERCAQIADRVVVLHADHDPWDSGYNCGARDVAAAIRSMGDAR